MAPTLHQTVTQAGTQITRGGWHWGSSLGAAYGPLTFGFRQSAPAYNELPDSDIQGTFGQVTAPEMAAVRDALRMWSLAANITFQEVNPGGYTNNATVLFGNYRSSTDQSQAFAYYPGRTSASAPDGDVWFNVNYQSTTSIPFGSYDYLTVLHEIGHALGLEHPGDYNAGPGQSITYENSAEYIEDTRQYSIMSYFDASNTGADHIYNGRTIYASTPLLHDFAAIQRLYGANWNAHAGNTTFGFNNSADAAYAIVSATQQKVFSVWDGSGLDTLDFSGYATNQRIDLNQGAFSDVGALTKNVSIAIGTVIENAVGGSGNDILIGNPVNNTFAGGAGSDTIFGGPGRDVVIVPATQAAAALAHNADGSWTISFAGQSDTLSNVEIASFLDGNRSLRLPTSNDLDGTSISDVLWKNSAGQVVAWTMNNGQLSQSVLVGAAATMWSIVGSGDLNADGTSDIVWYGSNGQLVRWTMSNGVLTSSALIGSATLDWSVAALGDLNGDGNTDVLWRNANGQVVEWLVAGGQVAQSKLVGSASGAWSIAGSGDFNGDATDDILWHSANGQVVIWDMAGGIASSSHLVGIAAPEWSIEETGDLDGNGTADILWRHDNGEVVEWLMSAGNLFESRYVGSAISDWGIVSQGDYNADGTDDILWRNTDGTVVQWRMVDGNLEASTLIAHASTDWQIFA